MKKLALILSGSLLAMGVVAGIGLSKGLSPVEVKADVVASGTITIDTTGGSWGDNAGDEYGKGQNISVYFTDGANTGWGEYVYCAYQQYLVEIPYSLDFTPTKMVAWRYSNWYGSETWAADPKCEDSANAWGKWNTTCELDFAADAHIVIESWNETNSNNDAECIHAYIHGSHYNGGTASDWGTLATLSNVKLNGSNHIEYYGECTFVVGQAFGVKLLSADWCVTFTLDDYVAGAFTTNESGNIECVTAGTYVFYYDRNAGSIYINDPIYAEADEWAQTFLGSGDTACASVTMAGWSGFATTYAALPEGSRTLMAELAYVDETAEPTTYYAKAVQRYDYVLKRYGTTSYTDFMGRVTNGKLSLSNNVEWNISQNASSIGLFITLGLIGVAGVGLLIAFRRKRFAK